MLCLSPRFYDALPVAAYLSKMAVDLLPVSLQLVVSVSMQLGSKQSQFTAIGSSYAVAITVTNKVTSTPHNPTITVDDGVVDSVV